MESVESDDEDEEPFVFNPDDPMEEEEEAPFSFPPLEGEEEEENPQDIPPQRPVRPGDEFLLPGEEGYVEPETDRSRATRRRREEEDYYEDEYGEGNVDMIRLRRATDVQEFLDDPRVIDEDDEADEHVAGMILPKVDLTDTNVYYRELFRVCRTMGNETTRLLKQLLVQGIPLSPPERTLCMAWIKYWSSYAVENHYRVLGKILSIPTGEKGAMEKLSGTMCVLGEVWRLKLIVNHHRLHELKNFKISDKPFLIKWLVEAPGWRERDTKSFFFFLPNAFRGST